MKFEQATFGGFRRSDGQVGVRNYLGIISTVTCANQMAQDVGRHVDGAAVFTHQQSCGQTQQDLALLERTLINLGRNPNLGAVLLVSLGCEGVNAARIAQEICSSGKALELVKLQQEGGYFGVLNEAGVKAQKLSMDISQARREEVSAQELRLGIKCGASDPTSALASNPAVGRAVDFLIESGGSAVFGETTEGVGAEHILSSRCVNGEVAQKLLSMVADVERRVRKSGGEIRGGNPSAGNIAGGITTLEEKSLGAIIKAGVGPIRDALSYGQCPPLGKGLFFVDSPGREPEILTALAAAGCQIILFSTGIGAPQGFPFVPVIKVCGNRKTVEKLADFIDVDVAQIILGRETVEQAGNRILGWSLKVASGLRSKAEAIRYFGSTAVYQTGPTV